MHIKYSIIVFLWLLIVNLLLKIRKKKGALDSRLNYKYRRDHNDNQTNKVALNSITHDTMNNSDKKRL